MEKREVVITGMGLVTSLGFGIEENWGNIRALKTGVAHYPQEGCPRAMQYYGKVEAFAYPFDIPNKLTSQMKFLNRGSTLGFAAALDAIKNSRIGFPDMNGIPPGRRALFIATGDFTKIGYDFFYHATKEATNGRWRDIDSAKLNSLTLKKVNPFFLLESISNNLFSALSALIDFKGPNTTLTSLSPCGGQSLELAARAIRQGKADIAVSAGCGNWITEIPMYELEGLGLLSGCAAGVESYRPFDKKRDGFIPGEGGAAIVLEERQSALRRGAVIYGTIMGFGNAIEHAEGPAVSVPERVTLLCINEALTNSGVKIEDLAFISPHGSGTKKGDRSELNSIAAAAGAFPAALCALKPYTGHMAAASDIAEIIFSVLGVRDSIVPATLNFNESEMEKEYPHLKFSNTHQPCHSDKFLSISYGIGGQSSAVVIRCS
ncbi:beta-ketoacyl-[acyl-carrier-protein] synthase family protein [Candidatus Magnetominusculus xianensis]|uniref:3-oxoacyl-[acyl-carrier-protein] synthase 2 n=1 Tax=Candidatus Magnetominusculus xianensis TaxID=1748249 RepID=A0ABR5SGS0_9BACT|nr:beta-ketoacyl synthase N-terminal-like domain-containing protein [Candidatus Magnetominusculus xianensis]KWT85892.1 3-oxoacyl-[acyl-carrier-protein] synthase 2 [Candidatus Magnetominusculus xianensis]MBF0403565.1 hypothetical protein [Nitrospirota bacterium]